MRKKINKDEWNRTESTEINPHIMVIRFSQGCQDNLVGEMMVFSINGSRKTGCP